ncbi:DJ-1/PfpI family protein [Mammaliicoccus vitulinus]|uniref:DJ-1/PfpI family protein n=1 Tax=Mammaliicoccus vitulinus TaxID=71237 RepID=UPI000F81F908|nr:DJ-1/PfpI family protein [Mammaliicoccus vitulinus]QQT15415.1 DJ-1/PfpI family protein [Mammaliicoccus vitulinus]QQY19281.1 DJ-1/PfpI family protein [Mammaliicoccus vitulinus]RTX89717.1 glutamine amidotransferase [Mammaliicoccus vitulinus]GGI03660.1 glutamine amidotransferase [Mammaliicoccus vitulinus]
MKRALIVLTEAYADWELSYVSAELSMSHSFKIDTVSLGESTVTSIGQIKTIVDYPIEQITEPYDALIIIGGNSWSTLENEQLIQLIKTSLDEGIIVGAICGAVDFLARNHLLTGFKHTGNDLNTWTTDEKFKQYTNSIDFINEDSVIDQNLVTANGSSSVDFAFNVILALGLIDNKEAEKNKYFYKSGFVAYKLKYGEIG